MKAIVLDKPLSIEYSPLRLADLPTPVINAIRKATSVPPLDYAECLWLEKEIKTVANEANLPQMLDYSILCDSTGFHIKCNVCPAFA